MGSGDKEKVARTSGLELCFPVGGGLDVAGLLWPDVVGSSVSHSWHICVCAACDLSVVCSELESLSCWLAEGVTSNTSDSESSSSKCVSCPPRPVAPPCLPAIIIPVLHRYHPCSEAAAPFSHVHFEPLEMLWPVCSPHGMSFVD